MKRRGNLLSAKGESDARTLRDRHARTPALLPIGLLVEIIESFLFVFSVRTSHEPGRLVGRAGVLRRHRRDSRRNPFPRLRGSWEVLNSDFSMLSTPVESESRAYFPGFKLSALTRRFPVGWRLAKTSSRYILLPCSLFRELPNEVSAKTGQAWRPFRPFSSEISTAAPPLLRDVEAASRMRTSCRP